MRRTALIAVLLVGVYFIVPVSASDRYPLLRWTATSACIAVVVLLIIRTVGKAFTNPAESLAGLLLSIISGVFAFALLDYIIAIRYPAEFVSLHTRVDALYFSLVTIATIGYGDVHAEGQAARIVVIVQIIFNVVVLSVAATMLANRIAQRVRDREGLK